LLFDEAHFGHAENPADAGGIDAVLGRKHDGNQEHQRRDGGQKGRAQKLLGRRQFGAQGGIAVVHVEWSLGVHDTK
jgi:hypothetical protein